MKGANFPTPMLAFSEGRAPLAHAVELNLRLRERDGGKDMSDTGPGAVQQAVREDHLAWLRAERAAFDEHEARGSAPQPGFQFGGGAGAFDELGDEEPVYRSLNFAGAEQFDAVALEDEPVYRSLDLGRLASPGPPARTPPDAHASWAQKQRPPLLRKQNAFCFKEPENPQWLGLLGDEPAQPSGQ